MPKRLGRRWADEYYQRSHAVWPPNIKARDPNSPVWPTCFPLKKCSVENQALAALQAYKPPRTGLLKTAGKQTATVLPKNEDKREREAEETWKRKRWHNLCWDKHRRQLKICSAVKGTWEGKGEVLVLGWGVRWGGYRFEDWMGERRTKGMRWMVMWILMLVKCLVTLSNCTTK